MSFLDDFIRNSGDANAVSQTPSKNPNDLSPDSGGNFFDYVMNSIEYHDSKIRRKFKDLEFPAVVLRTRKISKKELLQRTCKAFATKIIKNNIKTQKIYEVYAHIPEISGLLPQPSINDMRNYMHAKDDGGFPIVKRRYEMITSRYPKFYCADVEPMISEVYKVSFPDENFFYYGYLNKDERIQSETGIGEIASATTNLLQQGQAYS